MEDFYSVQELGLLAFLLLKGLKPVKAQMALTGRKVEFFFSKAEAQAAEEEFFSGAVVEAKAYSAAVRDGKTLVLQTMKRLAPRPSWGEGK